MKKKERIPIVLVSWKDTQGVDAGPLPVSDVWMLDFYIVFSVGFLLHKDEEKIILASQYCTTKDARFVNVIPKEAILEFKKIAYVRVEEVD